MVETRGKTRDVGPDVFVEHLVRWFAPFRDGKTLKLTIQGRDILGALIWYSLIVKRPEADEAVLLYANATWKSKSDADRSARLIPMWLHTIAERSPNRAVGAIETFKAKDQLQLSGRSVEIYRDLCRKTGHSPSIDPPAPPLERTPSIDDALRRALRATAGPLMNVEDDHVLVTHARTGQQYRIEMTGGRILRLPDETPVRLEIDWDSMALSPFKSMIDAADIADPFGVNYFRILVCAQILSGTLDLDVPIVDA